MPVETPAYLLYGASFFGALYLWSVSKDDARKIFGLSEIYEQLFSADKAVFFATLLTFVVLGGVAVQIIFAPTNVGQAFTCGLGWSYFLSSSGRARRSRAK